MVELLYSFRKDVSVHFKLMDYFLFQKEAVKLSCRRESKAEFNNKSIVF